jgi:hypothetical protein
MKDRLAEAMVRSEASGILAPQQMDLDVKDPERVAAEMGKAFQYSGLVENQVANDVLVIEKLLPHLDPDQARYIEEVWKPQELAHGEAHDLLLGRLGLDPIPVDLSVSRKIQAVGALNGLSPQLHRVFNMVYTTFGTIHEREANSAYSAYTRILRGMGETGLVETMIQPINAQEPLHKNVYRETSRKLWANMPNWERWLSRQIAARTFSPVGTSSRPEMTRPHFGEVALLFAGEQTVDEYAAPIVGEAMRIMEADSETDVLPRLVKKALSDCVEEARDKGLLSQAA